MITITTPSRILCDTEAEMQAYTASIGTLCFCKDTNKLWNRDETQWRVVTSSAGGASAWGDITGTLANQTDLNNALGGKADTHTHPYASDSDARLTDARTPLTHAHAESDITNLVTDLAGKSATGHAHAGTYEPANSNIQTHVGSAHAPSGAQVNADITKAEIEAKLTGAITSHSHAGGGGMNLLKTTADQTINAGAGVFTDITGLTFPVVNGTDYAFHFYITFQSALATTGWRAGVNCPAGTLDFWAESDIIANGAAGVATHTERHNTVRDDMTLLTATITQAVDLAIRIEGRYKCTANGTFAARFANELAANTQIVVQKGSWGWWF